ncbi:MAG: AarF/UbiB family protein [Actinobacteria bacterium]|nr:AarF/UbiB family protein [Actinomycetota bacterium]MCL5446022.1 AarF/UbiB family protein [Actinomycetota bacterium]
MTATSPDRASDLPSDLAIGAFSEVAPWTIDPTLIPWLEGVDLLRDQTRDTVPHLLRRQLLPPGRRAITIGYEISAAILRWYFTGRRKEKLVSRTQLSRNMRIAFEHLGPTFIKLGQILSAGEGIFPQELVSEFAQCRDRVPADSFQVVRQTVERELGRSLTEVFASFDPVPLAAASIAQVHAAQLRTGESVVVKVQRPYVKRLVHHDIAAMSWIAPLLGGRIPVATLANPPALVELFAETIVEELDFRLEAANMLDFASVLARTGQHALVVPRPHPSLVTEKVLVMERLDGFEWGDVAGMRAAGVDTEEVLRASLTAFLEGAILYGVFHGDLHGGNLSVLPDGKVAVMDFGITGRLDDLKRTAFIKLMVSATSNDARGQVEALKGLGALPPDADIDTVVSDLRLDQPPLDPTRLSADQLASELRDLTKALLSHGAKLPKELTLFIKDMIFLDQAVSLLAPDIDLLSEIGQLLTYFYEHHGEKIAQDLGISPDEIPAVDTESIRASLMVAEPVDHLTYSDLRARREALWNKLENDRQDQGDRQDHLRNP